MDRGLETTSLFRQRRKPLHGFTLIELLVVISIIALLIGILLPALGRARDAARQVTCLAHQRQLVMTVHTYANDFRTAMPLARDDRPGLPSGMGTRWHSKLAVLYLGGLTRKSGSELNIRNPKSNPMLCPAHDVAIARKSINDSDIRGASFFGNGRLFNTNGLGDEFKLSQISAPSRRLVLTDRNGYWIGGLDRNAPYPYNTASSFWSRSTSRDNGGTWANEAVFDYRHRQGGSINLALLDGAAVNWTAQRMHDSVLAHESGTQPANNPDWVYWRGK